MNDGKSSEFSWFACEWIHSAETWLDRHVRHVQCNHQVQTHKGTFIVSCMCGFSLLNALEHANCKRFQHLYFFILQTQTLSLKLKYKKKKKRTQQSIVVIVIHN